MAAVAHLTDNAQVMAHLWNTLGLSPNQINALDAEGIDSLRSFSMLKSSDVTDMSKRLSSLPVNRGGVHVGAVTVRKLQATLMWWFPSRQKTSKISSQFRLNTSHGICCGMRAA